MRNIPGWPTSNDALEPIHRVVHGGVDRDVNEFSFKRTLPSSHHAQVVGVGGIVQTTGQVKWAARSDVLTSHPTAFNRVDNWPPRTREPVDIYTGYRTTSGDLLARQLRGTISGSSGDPMSETSSGVVDLIARLSRKVNLPPLLNNMPPLADNGPWRGVGLYPTFFTDKAARAGGFNSTPPTSGVALLSAPLMGSAWPEHGTLVTGLRHSDRNNANAVWKETPWGMGVSDAYLRYNAAGSNTALSTPLELTAMFSGTSDVGRLGVVYGGTVSIYIIRDQYGCTAQLWNASGATNICALGNPVADTVTLRLVPNGGTIEATLRDAAGRQATGSIAKPAEANGNISAVAVESTGQGMAVGGVQVSIQGVPFASVNYTRSAFITPSAHNATLAASPPIENVPAKELLDEQARAELAALWIDGDGFLRWVNRDRLVSGPAVATLTAKDHLKSLQWEEDFTAVSYSVEVKSRRPEAVLQSKVPRHEVWQGNYGSVDADGTEVFEELIHPDADEDWIMVDASFNNSFNTTNRLEGSDVALYHFFESGTKGQAGYTTQEGYERAWAGATLTRVDWRTYKLVTRVFNVSVSGYEKYEFSLKIPSERQGPAPGLWPAGLGGMGFPVIRAYGKVMWSDSTATALTGATADAPTLTHDVGWWVQDAGACQAIANMLAAQTGAPRPFLSGVSIVPDARLERGDIVTLTDPDITGVQLRCLVVGIEDTFTSSPIRWSQSCDFRILSTTIL